ncbi:importin-alpha export [Moniliophthora roreri MCA 2997]|uniref:Importin-alpha export n=1 Tax=Moniliophthora roreri (strain MCA 2997) TaxID=1381753 RepID=V2Y461_MONRO|nr:importin-alpha export [Moniliophthora roreri MCA 2997]
MSDLPALLLASLNPATRKQAEQNLNALSEQQGFLSHLLTLVLNQSQDRAVRLSASVYLKNLVKLRWEEDVQPLAEQDKATLRSQLVPAMLRLSDPADKGIRAQVAESVALVAELDFPSKWPDLIDQLVSSLQTSDSNTILGVLHTAHSIFRQWRAHVRSDQLFTEINLVISKFMLPFLDLFRQTATSLLKTALPTPEKAIQTQCMTLLVEIYYDFTCQDIPPAIEDSHKEFFAGEAGWFPVFMAWDPDDLRNDDPDEPTPSLPSQLKRVILEVVELFVKLYTEQLLESNAVPTFVQGVWSLVGSNKLTNVSYDPLVSQCLRFLSTAIRSGHYTQLFTTTETISTLVEGVVIPNVALRQHELEQFEDDPLEFIRLDLSVGGGVTRRQAAADVVKALVSTGGGDGEKITTEVVGNWIGKGLDAYVQSGKSKDGQGWKAKDSAIYLLTALATRGGTSQHGVTSTNALVDVVKFFSDHVYEDLESQGGVHPILQVDAIRFLYTFRNQLTKPQLLSVLPLLVRHLKSDNYVTYTYAAITIERVLAIRGQPGQSQMLFIQTDIHEISKELIEALLSKIEVAGTPEKVAENDHLIKCVMRVIVTARQSLTPEYETLLKRLVGILGVISRNPSNPKFDQYIFESVSALMRFVVTGAPNTLPAFEGVLFQPFTVILQNDIDQYIPYTFQILAQMLSLHNETTIPPQYESLLPFLLTPAVWAQKGSVPGLVRLLKAYLRRGAQSMVSRGQVASILAVVQQRLIPSRVNDVWGIELLMAVVSHVGPNDLRQYFKGVMMTLLTRMQTSKTDNYVYLFVKFLLYTMALNVDGLGPDYVITGIEEIQPGLWSQIATNFVLPQVPKMQQKDKKVVEVGMIKLLFRSERFIQPPSVQAWPGAFTSLIKLFGPPGTSLKDAKSSSSGTDDDAFVAMTAIDEEEQSAGYQAAYSRLAAAESADLDPFGYVSDPEKFLGEEMVGFSKQQGGKLRVLLGQCDPQVVGPVIQSLAGAGYAI